METLETDVLTRILACALCPRSRAALTSRELNNAACGLPTTVHVTEWSHAHRVGWACSTLDKVTLVLSCVTDWDTVSAAAVGFPRAVRRVRVELDR